MLQRWQTVGNTVSDLTGPRFEHQTFRSRDERLPLDQLAGHFNRNIVKCRFSSAHSLLLFCLKSQKCGICKKRLVNLNAEVRLRFDLVRKSYSTIAKVALGFN